MTAPAGIPEENLWRTNPVWCLERRAAALSRDLLAWATLDRTLDGVVAGLALHDVTLPPPVTRQLVARRLLSRRAMRHAREAAPGVVGLLVAPDEAGAFVVPLAARGVRDWWVAPTLPFRAETLQALLARLLSAGPAAMLGGVPERLAYRIDDPLGADSEGSSMDVAGVFAMVAAACVAPSPALRAACAVVEVDASGRLRASRHVAAKLGAFAREYGAGSLLLRAADDPIAATFDPRFERVWALGSLDELRARLDAEGLLGPFVRRVPLRRAELETLDTRLRVMLDDPRRQDVALDLARRVAACPVAPDVPTSLTLDLRRRLIGGFLRAGRPTDALGVAVALRARLDREGDAAHDDARARAATSLAAVLLDLHRFADVIRLLTPWRALLVRAPRRASPETRVAVFNTLARALLVDAPRRAWEPLFRRALALQGRTDPAGRARTRNYLLHALLRADDLAAAAGELRRVEPPGTGDDFSAAMTAAWRADLARRAGRSRTDPALESLEPTAALGHPAGIYFQATARQRGRARDDAMARWARAERAWLVGVLADDPSNVRAFVAAGMRLGAAARAQDDAAWRAAGDFLRASGARSPGIKAHFRELWRALSGGASTAVAEAWLDRVPYL